MISEKDACPLCSFIKSNLDTEQRLIVAFTTGIIAGQQAPGGDVTFGLCADHRMLVTGMHGALMAIGRQVAGPGHEKAEGQR